MHMPVAMSAAIEHPNATSFDTKNDDNDTKNNDNDQETKDELIKILQQQVQDLVKRMNIVEGELNTIKYHQHERSTSIGENQQNLSSPSVTEENDNDKKYGENISNINLFGSTTSTKITTKIPLINDNPNHDENTLESRPANDVINNNLQDEIESQTVSRPTDDEIIELISSKEGENKRSNMTSTRDDDEEEQKQQDEIIDTIFQDSTQVNLLPEEDQGRDNEENASTKRSRSFLEWSGLNRIGSSQISTAISNTGTIHIHAIAVFADAVQASNQNDDQRLKKQIKSWVFATFSLLFVIIQMIVLNLVIYDSSMPTCSSHEACPVGKFCFADKEFSILRQPRCVVCEHATYVKLSLDLNCDNMIDDPFWEITDIDQTFLWFDRNGEYNYDRSIIPDFNTTITTTGLDGDIIYNYCLMYKYCTDTMPFRGQDETEIARGTIAYLDLLMSEMSDDQIIILAFVAILLGSIIAEELTEASVEDAVLNTISNDIFSNSIPLKMIRVSLRIRQLFLPWLVGAATISVMLTDNLSAKNILLNFLAVSFLVESDNMLSSLLFSNKEREFVENILFSDESRYNGVTVSSLWPRMLAASISVATVFVVVFITDISNFFDAFMISVTVQMLLLTATYMTVIAWGLLNVWKTWKFDWVSNLRVLLEFSRSISAFIIFELCALFPFLIIYKERNKERRVKVFLGIILLFASAIFWIGVDSNYRNQGEHRPRYFYRVIILLSFAAICFVYFLWVDALSSYRLGVLKALGIAELFGFTDRPIQYF